MTKVGFIGLGEQGKPMAVNLAKAGDIELMVHDLRNEPIEELVTFGARRASSPREVGSHSDIIEVIVVDDAQVEAVVLGEQGVVAGAKRGSIVAIHSTIRPATVRKIAAACEKRGIGVIDAPVSGGPRGAQTRTMCYMAGGDKELVDKCRPIFEVSGDNIFHLGALGAGMIAKLAHQVTICLNVVAAAEGFQLARKAGLDLAMMQEVIRAGGASSRVADNWMKHMPSPNAGKLWRKDLMLALECAEELGLDLQGASMAQQLIEKVLVNDQARRRRCDLMATMLTSSTNYGELIQSDRISGRVYYDAGIFREELEKIWYREWVYVAHESEVPQPGDYVTRQIGLQPVIVSRDEDGEIHLMLNRCMHRGNTVCQSDRGNSHAFRCAYHGWTYDNRGDLVGVPYAGGYDESFRKNDFALAKVPRVGSHRGLIFASLSATGPSLDEHLGPAKRLIDQFVDLSPEGEVVVRSGVLKHSYKGNWKMALENSVDGYHPNILHHAAMVMMTRGRTDMESVFGERSDALARDLGNGTAQLDLNPVHTRNGGRVVAPGWSKETDAKYRAAMEGHYGSAHAEKILAEGPPHFCIFPNIIFILNQFRVIQPLSVDETVISYFPTLLKGAPEEINRRRLNETYMIHGPAGRVAPDDIEAYERNQAGFEARVNEWLVLRRGLHREVKENGGVAGHETDETTQRGIWRHYREVMSR